MPKVHNKPIKRPRKGFKQESKRQPELHPGLAHRTVRCATGQCPVHQGTRRPTSHLREFSEALRYNSPDMSGAHRTVRWIIAESPLEFPKGDEFEVWVLWCTGHVRWHTGQSGAPDQRCLRLSLCSFVEPNTWSFYWLSVNLWHLYNLYTRAN